ncbi:Tim44 domain-containing protein [Desulfovibrio piger]|uniref:Tim44 domain-containing protein n=1 Tax=Desulfovibrio piger TaxID=901 RepID=UPI0019567663|nr:Tim44-like domain-containing protein [Desulfovibrio piger]MBM6834621.1 Tim44 domain-containing protein [Desulfovibrio piger]
MKIKAILTMLIMLGGACMYALPDTADAARLGGGRSFGSRPSMSQPAQAPSAMQRQSTQQRQQAAQAQQPQRKGFLGGMGGLLGGLLAGSLIGSLLFGGGFSGGGIMDILLLGILLFVGLKLFARARSKAQPAPAGAGNAPMGGMEPPLQRNDTAASGWDTLSGQNNAYNSQPEVVIPMPADFDAEEFLRGAKMVYNRLQAAWDSRDLNDIAQFASPAVMDAVRQQLAEETEPSKTEILLVNAQLLSVVNEDKEQRAQVYFDVLMRERPDQPTPSNVREIWHFVRELDGGTWKLDGIQQVA